MASRHGRSPIVRATLVGIGVWLVGYLLALVVVAATGPPTFEGFSLPGLAAAVYVTGTVAGLFLLAGMPFPLPWLVPGLAGLAITAAGGAVAVERADHLESGWTAAKVGASVSFGVCLVTLVALATYLVPATPFSNTPISVRYVIVLFGNLLLPALFGALGGALQHASASRDDEEAGVFDAA